MKKLIIALIALGLFGCDNPDRWLELPGKDPADTGRYQLLDGKSGTYMIDTRRGRVWQMVKSYQRVGEPLLFQQIDNPNWGAEQDPWNITYESFFKAYPPKESKKKEN